MSVSTSALSTTAPTPNSGLASSTFSVPNSSTTSNSFTTTSLPTSSSSLIPSSTTPFSSPPSSTDSSVDSSSTATSTSSASNTSRSSTTSSSSLSSSSSTPATSSSISVVSVPVTTVVETVVGTSNGQAFTTVFSTQTTARAGATVTVASNSAATTHSTSHTGAIVGGVVGGTIGLLILILGALLFLRHRRRLEDEAFDGNFDPNRIVRSPTGTRNIGGARGPTLPNIPVTNSNEHLGNPEMAEVDDDGMGGRLNASTVGAGIVAPYPLYHPTSTRSPPPSARSWGNSSEANHSMYNGPAAEWRGPSPGPSIPTQYTGGSSSGSYGHSSTGMPPSSYPAGMLIGHLPPGASPGPAGVGVPAGAYATGHIRRPSAGSSADRHTYTASGPGTGSNTSSRTGSVQQQGGGRFAVANPDEATQNRHGISEDARRAYIAGGPSGKSPTGPSQPHPREVLVHQDAGGVDNTTPSSEGPDEIPPTYDSLLGAAGMNTKMGKEKRLPK